MRRRFRGQERVPAHDQAFRGVQLRDADLRHVALVEERQLQVALLGQGADPRRAQGADPGQARGFEVFLDEGVGDQPAVFDDDDPIQREAVAKLVQLTAQGGGIGGVALEDLDRDRASVPVAEQGDDLELPLLLVPGVAVCCQLALQAFEVDRGQIAEDEGAVLEMPPGESPFDLPLAGEQPVHRFVEIIGRGVFDAEFLGEGVVGGFAGESSGGGEFGPRFDDARRDHGDCEGALLRRGAVEQSFEAEPLQGAEYGGDVSVRFGADNLEGGVERGQCDASLEQGSEPFNEVVRPLGEVCECAFLDLSVLPVGLSQQDGWWGVAVGHPFDVHGFGL